MRNPEVGSKEAEDLRKQVDKVLRGLGNPEPPLDLRLVRELLDLDLKYYSSSDAGHLQETVSRLKIAGKQILKRPTLLVDVVRKADIAALWVPDHKRILIDANSIKLKHRWYEGHEIGHSLAPWHKRFLFGDDSQSLSKSCHETLEAEANFVSGQLLFLQDRFTTEGNDSPAAMATVLKLAKKFGNTKTSTLWRFVEQCHDEKFMFGIVSQHPHKPKKDFDPKNPCKYFIESPGFKENFAGTSDLKIFEIIKGYCRHSGGGPLGSTQATLTDANGDLHTFTFESFSNTHEVLTLAVHAGKSRILL